MRHDVKAWATFFAHTDQIQGFTIVADAPIAFQYQGAVHAHAAESAVIVVTGHTRQARHKFIFTTVYQAIWIVDAAGNPCARFQQ